MIEQSHSLSERLSPRRSLIGDIVEVLVDAVITIDADHKILYANEATSSLFGYSREALLGMTLLDLIPERFRSAHAQGVSRFLASDGLQRGTSGYVRVLGLHRDGREIPLSLSMTHTVVDGRQLVTGVLRDLQELLATQAALADRLAELESLNKKLSSLAEVDPMTGAFNRRALQRLGAEVWKDADASQICSIAICDIDHFKAYNDHYGHMVGDRCLMAVANAVSDVVGAHAGSLIRFGGEEFVALLPGVEEEAALMVAEQMRTVVSAQKIEHRASNVSQLVTLSVGIATARPASVGFDLLLRRADDALYFAKRYRDCVHAWGNSTPKK